MPNVPTTLGVWRMPAVMEKSASSAHPLASQTAQTLGSELAQERPRFSNGPDLLATLEAEIIPRLMMAHRGSRSACEQTRPPPTQDEIVQLAHIAACHDLTRALSFVETMCRDGLSLEVILLDLVAQSARLLGAQWQDDLRTFTEVCAGLGTLHQVLHVLGPSFAPALPHQGLVVLTVAPGEEHTLGVHLMGEFLRRDGWGVQVDSAMDRDDLLQVVSTQKVEMLGISVSNDFLLPKLPDLLSTARKVSKNPDMLIMLGGALDLRAFATPRWWA